MGNSRWIITSSLNKTTTTHIICTWIKWDYFKENILTKDIVKYLITNLCHIFFSNEITERVRKKSATFIALMNPPLCNKKWSQKLSGEGWRTEFIAVSWSHYPPQASYRPFYVFTTSVIIFKDFSARNYSNIFSFIKFPEIKKNNR